MVEQREELLAPGAGGGDDADRPGVTVLAKPRPRPPTTAVPQSGPITRRPRSCAVRLSTSSCSSGTLSLKTITSLPESSASIASTKALAPGTETRTRAVAGTTQRTGRCPGRCHLARTVIAPVRVEQRPVDAGERLVEGRCSASRSATTRSLVVASARDREAHLRQHLDVQAGRHRHLGREHAVEVLDGAADLEQGHRVGVRPGTQLDVQEPVAAHAGSPTDAHSSAAAQRHPRAARSRWSARRRAGPSRPLPGGRSECDDVRRELWQHLALQRAVQQRRGQQGGVLHPLADCLVDDGGGDPGRPVQRQPTAEHVVPPGSQAVTGTDQAGDGLDVQRRHGRWARVRRSQGRDPHLSQPADHERDPGKVQHTVVEVRRTGPELRQVARRVPSAHGTCAACWSTTPTHHPPTSRYTACAPRWTTRTGPAGASSSRSRTRGGALTGITSPDVTPRRLVCTERIGLTTVAGRSGVPPASEAGVAV